ncbi:hypothetical protein ACFLVX_03070 [Chloroflexota bacterium]
MVLIAKLTALFIEANYVMQTEGLIPLFRRCFAFVIGCFFQYKTFHLNELRLEERNEADFMPRIQDLAFKIVYTNEQADELVGDGFKFRYSDGVPRDRLDKGAMALCIFIGRELAHIGWVAMNEEAKKSLDNFPLQVDFLRNEVYAGGVWTNPKYRRMGLQTYGAFKRCQFLRERGAIVLRGLVDTEGVASQIVTAKMSGKLIAEARYLRILWWKSWKKKPLTQIS